MDTIKELEDWMVDNNIKNTFTSSGRYVTDIGEGLENVYGLYIWYYFDEKGNRTDLDFFKNEKDAVQFLYEYLLKLKNPKPIKSYNSLDKDDNFDEIIYL
jgi:hypothetical protein